VPVVKQQYKELTIETVEILTEFFLTSIKKCIFSSACSETTEQRKRLPTFPGTDQGMKYFPEDQ